MRRFGHPNEVKFVFLRLGRNHSMRATFIHAALLAGVVLFTSTALFAQEPAQPPAQAPPAAESSSKQKPAPSAAIHSNDFLVRGTVFTQEGLALPGAELRIRRTADKKFRWQTISNSRGDFAVRVKMGADYEVTVRAKGFEEQSLPVNAKTGDRFKDLVFRMQHQGGKKS
jgi:Carboxypeptidase regulatory-like domain